MVHGDGTLYLLYAGTSCCWAYMGGTFGVVVVVVVRYVLLLWVWWEAGNVIYLHSNENMTTWPSWPWSSSIARRHDKLKQKYDMKLCEFDKSSISQMIFIFVDKSYILVVFSDVVPVTMDE